MKVNSMNIVVAVSVAVTLQGCCWLACGKCSKPCDNKTPDKCCNEQRCIGVTHTQALAGAYLESTRARTSATVAQRPASISEMPRIALTASSTSCGERWGCSGVMLPDMDDSTIMPQVIPQIALLLLKINVPHCLITAERKFPRRLFLRKEYNKRRSLRECVKSL